MTRGIGGRRGRRGKARRAMVEDRAGLARGRLGCRAGVVSWRPPCCSSSPAAASVGHRRQLRFAHCASPAPRTLHAGRWGACLCRVRLAPARVVLLSFVRCGYLDPFIEMPAFVAVRCSARRGMRGRIHRAMAPTREGVFVSGPVCLRTRTHDRSGDAPAVVGASTTSTWIARASRRFVEVKRSPRSQDAAPTGSNRRGGSVRPSARPRR